MEAVDALAIEVRLASNPLADGAALQPWLRALDALPAPLRPRRVGLPEGHPRQVTLEVLRAALAAGVPWLAIAGPDLRGVLRAEGTLSLTIPTALASEHVDAIFALANAIAAHAPSFGWAHPTRWLTAEARARLAHEPLAEPTWLAIVGKAQRDAIHPAVFTGAGDRIWLLPNGCAVVAATEHFAALSSRRGHDKLKKSFARLRPDLSAGEIDAHFPGGPPGDDEPTGPAPITEWCPLAEAPASDVAEVEPALARLRDAAASFVVRCEADVEGLDSDDASFALEMIDARFAGAHLWWEDDLDAFTDELGAYLGERMVRALAGRWVPMDERARTYVAIGDRAWFPFRRVGRFLDSYERAAEFPLRPFFIAARVAAG